MAGPSDPLREDLGSLGYGAEGRGTGADAQFVSQALHGFLPRFTFQIHQLVVHVDYLGIPARVGRVKRTYSVPNSIRAPSGNTNCRKRGRAKEAVALARVAQQPFTKRNLLGLEPFLEETHQRPKREECH